jgi:trimethylamine--corrinoid protein Co-methyltransferase
MLNDEQLDEIHAASLEILRKTGVRVLEAESLELLRAAGCDIADGDLVRFPADVVERAIEAAPSRIVLHGRNGEPRVFLEGHRSFFGTGSDLPHTLDLESGERRDSLLSDVENAARLVDALPNIDFLMSSALPSDVHIETSDRKSFLAMVSHTTKPIVFTSWDNDGLTDIIAMAEAVAGGEDRLREAPFLLAYLEPTSPLRHSEVVLRKVLTMADRGLPFVYAAGAVEGASVPVTSAASLAISNAEFLSGLVIAQLRRPGTPVVMGTGNGPLDMKTMVGTYAAPEFMLNIMGAAELAHHRYDLPVWGFAGCSDSKLPDAQAGFESGMWILWAALVGANLVHDVGYVESGLTNSSEMIVLCDDAIGMVRRLLGDFEVTAETLGLEAIDRIGPGGHFLTDPHTMEHYRKVWYPSVFDRRNHESWQKAGGHDARRRARDRARDLITNHQPAPIEPAIAAELERIVAAADERTDAPSP